MVVSTFVGEKRQARSHTLTAFLCKLISGLVDENKNESGSTFESSTIWKSFMDKLQGGEMIGRFTYNSEEFGEISQKALTTMLIDQFDAKRPKHTGSKTELIFDIDKLNRMKSKYNLEPDIKVITESDESDESLVGLDRHLSKGTDSDKTQDNSNENTNNFNDSNEKSEDNSNDQSSKDVLSGNNATQATQAIKHKHKFYFLNGSGKYHCENCNASGDRFYMEETYCKGFKK